MPSWDAGSKYRLLLAIITVLDTKPPKWEEVVKLMGPGYTAESVRQQYQKIKKQTMAELNGAASAGGAAAGSTTPRKQGRANGASQSSNGKRKGAAAHEDEEDEEVETSPPKKSMVKHESKVDHALVTKVEQEEDLYA